MNGNASGETSPLVEVRKTETGFEVRVGMKLASTRTVEEAQAIAGEISAALCDRRRVASGGRNLRLNIYPELKEIGADLGDEVSAIIFRQ